MRLKKSERADKAQVKAKASRETLRVNLAKMARRANPNQVRISNFKNNQEN